ncbi:hypothetical protein O1L60_34925 [Streptomyces diastatochromogenes]|nr:hypothetical protein [Streptomyces diastatochromogenes]
MDRPDPARRRPAPRRPRLRLRRPRRPHPGAATTGLRRRLADDRLLLVLDSCEHLAGPCARLVAELLAAAPDSPSSPPAGAPRRPRRAGRRPRPLPPAGADALELLRRAAGADFPAAGPAGEICVRLEGIPLALELAAAQIRLQGAEAVRDQLGTRLDAPPEARFDLLAHPDGCGRAATRPCAPPSAGATS